MEAMVVVLKVKNISSFCYANQKGAQQGSNITSHKAVYEEYLLFLKQSIVCLRRVKLAAVQNNVEDSDHGELAVSFLVQPTNDAIYLLQNLLNHEMMLSLPS